MTKNLAGHLPSLILFFLFFISASMAGNAQCNDSSKPTFGFNFNGTLTANINNGIRDQGESASLIVCDGNGQYFTSGHFNSSSSNFYNITLTPSGGTLFFDGDNETSGGVITAADLTASAGSHLVKLADPAVGGTLIQTITPFTDLNNNGILDEGDCAGDPIVYTYTVTPKQTWYLDADGDQHASQKTQACSSPGAGWTLTQLPVDDCNDSDPSPCPNNPPRVSITNPATATNYIAPGPVFLSADASDSGGEIRSVAFYSGSTLLFSDVTAPYSGQWNSVPTGSYIITAVATDNTGLTATSAPVRITVIHNRPPSVSITSPAEGAIYATPASIVLSADASSHGGRITTVRFYDGTTLIHTEQNAPYLWTWNKVAGGTYTITAKATDTYNRTTTSVPVHFTVTRPSCTAASKPTFGFNFNGTPTANINNGIRDSSESANFTACDGSGQYFTSGHTNSSSSNLYNIVVTSSGGRLLYDGDINIASAVITAADLVASAGPHTIRLADAAVGGTVIQTITPFTDFNDNGILDAGDCAGDPIVYTYTITAKQTWYLDADGDQHASQTMQACSRPGAGWTLTQLPVDDCNDNDPNPCIIPPVVNLTSPAKPTNYIAPGPIFLSAGASDPDGTIQSVDFYSGSTLLFRDLTAPYSGQWDSVPTGSYIITAVATDNSGLITTSAPVHITVLHNRPPTVNITSPAEGATYTAPAPVFISAGASSHGGKIKTVKFYSGTTLIHTEQNAPYLFTWNNVQGGNYTLTAKATDTYNRTTTSAPVHFTVIPQQCTTASKPTFGFNFNGTLTANINNGVQDPGESASIIVCNGSGQYYTSGHFNSSPSNLYNIVVTSSGGTILYDGDINIVSAVITAADLVASAGKHTLRLADPAFGGTVIQTITPFADFNNNGILDDGDCAGDPIVYTYTVTPCSGISALSLSRSPTVDKNSAVSIQLLPNPAISSVNINITGLKQNEQSVISVISAAGIVLKTLETRGSNQTIKIDVSSFSGGMYIIKMVSGDKVMYRQFIKL